MVSLSEFRKSLENDIDYYFPIQNQFFRICLCGNYQVDIIKKNAYTMHHYTIHATACTHVLSKMKQRDIAGFNCVREWVIQNKSRNLKINSLFECEINASDLLVRGIENKSPFSKQISNIQKPNLEAALIVDSFMENSFVFNSYVDLPESKGVYLVRFLNNDNWQALYVGCSENLKNRWRQHHRNPEIEFLKSLGIIVECRCVTETNLFQFRMSITRLESQLIDVLKPKLNYSAVRKLVRA